MSGKKYAIRSQEVLSAIAMARCSTLVSDRLMSVSFVFPWLELLIVPEGLPLFQYLRVMDERVAHACRFGQLIGVGRTSP
jgi:hypothetical protein